MSERSGVSAASREAAARVPASMMRASGMIVARAIARACRNRVVIGDEDSGIQGLCLLSCGTPLCAFEHGKSPETIPSRMVLSGKPSLLSVAGIGKGKTRLKSIAFLLLRGGIRNIFRVGIARKHRSPLPGRRSFREKWP
jgi:hypothetical protein